MNAPCAADLLSCHLPSPRHTREVWRYQGQDGHFLCDEVVEETPVALVYNGISHAVVLASPTDLTDLALGFSLSEGIVRSSQEIYDCEVHSSPQGIEVRLEIASRAFMSLKDRRRTLAGRTGCGVCGLESLEALHDNVTSLCTPLRPQPTSGISLHPAALQRALRDFPRHQPLFQATGAVHAAAWVSPAGEILCVREDVGRHNALDKLIGALHTQARQHALNHAAPDWQPDAGWVLVSSRASYEMVQKIARAGIHTLIAVSAPTAYAIRLAEESGITLAGFARGERFVVYSHPQRINTQEKY